jgi:uncharacterized protein YutE (UPF0331/DUF86 family)
MVDRDLVLRRMSLLDTYLEQLAGYRSISVDEYRADWKTQRVIERTLHLAIEACMDVADHLVADRRLRVPETGADTFDILTEAGLLPQLLGPALASMVGFRNILVHDYAGIDPALVVGGLHDDLSDLEQFRDIVAAVI